MKRYFEFLEQEYYGLITVSVQEDVVDYAPVEAANLYVQHIGGEGAQEVLAEGEPVERTKAEAFEIYMRKTADDEDAAKMPLEVLINDFDDSKNEVLIIDGNLL